MSRVLVVGASGTLGRHVVHVLQERGLGIRALTRSGVHAHDGNLEVVRADITQPATLQNAFDGFDAVISCAGASMSLKKFGNRRSFHEVDFLGHLNVLHAARSAGVGRFVYVSLHGAEKLLRTEYARAHEDFVAALAESGLSYTVVRPTGYFAFFTELLRMAMRGWGVVVGDGSTRTNPVHEADVARACVDVVSSGDTSISVGGPEVFTRRQLVEAAFEAAGRPPRIVSVPPGVMQAFVGPVRLLNPRLAALAHFGVEVSGIDTVAPAAGSRDIRTYFAEVVQKDTATAGAGGAG